MSEIYTEFTEETRSEHLDDGVEKRVEASEEFVFQGEQIERETNVQLLEDGGIHITQSMQGCFDSLTLGSSVVRRMVREVRNE